MIVTIIPPQPDMENPEFFEGDLLISDQEKSIPTVYLSGEWEERGFEVGKPYVVESTPFDGAKSMSFRMMSYQDTFYVTESDLHLLLCRRWLEILFNGSIPKFIYYKLL